MNPFNATPAASTASTASTETTQTAAASANRADQAREYIIYKKLKVLIYSFLKEQLHIFFAGLRS